MNLSNFTIYLSICLLHLFLNSHKLQAQTFEWAGVFEGGTITSISNMVNKKNGDLIVGGSHQGTDLDLGSDYVKTREGGFIAQYSKDKELISYKDFGWYFRPMEILLDEEENIYVGGYYSYELIFEGLDDTITPITESERDIVLMKFSPDGDLKWLKTIGTSGDDILTAMAIDQNGDIVTAGRLNGSHLFLNKNLEDTLLTPGEGCNFLLSKFSPSGELLMIASSHRSTYASAEELVVDSDNSILILGDFHGNFYPNRHDPDSFTTDGPINIFLAKYSSNGKKLWIKTFGGNGNHNSHDILLDKDENIYITGNFEGLTDFDPSRDTFNLYNEEFYEYSFLTKLTKDGAFIYSNKIMPIREMAFDRHENLYVIGAFTGTIDVDPSLKSHYLISSGYGDLNVGYYTKEAEMIWAYSTGSYMPDNGVSLSLDLFGNLYLAGWNNADMDFDFTSGYYPSGLYGYNGGFILKYQVDEPYSPNNLNKSNDISIIPNPSNGFFKIQSNTLYGKSSLRVYDVTGIERFRQEVDLEQKIPIKLEGLPSGLYSLVIQNQSKQYNTRIIIR